MGGHKKHITRKEEYYKYRTDTPGWLLRDQHTAAEWRRLGNSSAVQAAAFHAGTATEYQWRQEDSSAWHTGHFSHSAAWKHCSLSSQACQPAHNESLNHTTAPQSSFVWTLNPFVPAKMKPKDQRSQHTLNALLCYLVKYMCFKNLHAQELCEANCRARLKLSRKIQPPKIVVKNKNIYPMSILHFTDEKIFTVSTPSNR